MKKVMSLLLLVVLLASFAPALAESDADVKTFTPNLTAAMDSFSAEDWMETGLSRALFSTLISLDFSVSDEPDAVVPDLVSGSFVGRKGNILTLCTPANDGENLLYLIYSVGDKLAGYYFTEKLPGGDAGIKLVMQSVCDDGFEKNSTDDMMDAISMIQDIFNSANE